MQTPVLNYLGQQAGTQDYGLLDSYAQIVPAGCELLRYARSRQSALSASGLDARGDCQKQIQDARDNASLYKRDEESLLAILL